MWHSKNQAGNTMQHGEGSDYDAGIYGNPVDTCSVSEWTATARFQKGNTNNAQKDYWWIQFTTWPDVLHMDSRDKTPAQFELNTHDFYCNLKNSDINAGEVTIVISDDGPKKWDWEDAFNEAKKASKTGCKAEFSAHGGVKDPRVEIHPPKSGSCKKTKFHVDDLPKPLTKEVRDKYADPRQDLGYTLTQP
jgi:hypothetical protein